MMEGTEEPLTTTAGMGSTPIYVVQQILLQHRSFSVAPILSIKTAVLALRDYVLEDGIHNVVALQKNIKRVVYCLYSDEQELQPYASRTLAHISFQLCDAFAQINQDLAKRLCHALVAEAFTGLRHAWNNSEDFSEMSESDQADFLFKTNTVADFYALGLIDLRDFTSILDYIILKVKNSDLFNIMLFEFVSRGLTHSASKLTWEIWGRIRHRIVLVPKSSWDFSRPSYEDTCKVIEIFEQDARSPYQGCSLPFKETASSGGWLELDTLCESIPAEVMGSGDQIEDSLCMYLQGCQL